jgi:eukaryotic-like serine/threonine-protein kinase
MSLSAGMRLGPYEILGPLGAGGMGEVYKARDTRLDRTVALKVLPAHLAGDEDRRARFEREARTISSLNHSHICTLFDVGRQESTDYLVMEYLEGETLADRLSKGRLTVDQVLRLGVEMAGALEAAHRAGITHRDLKPGNVMLTKGGAKLLDFGLAKTPMSAGGADAARSELPTRARPLTSEGSLVGTLPYMAPEQVEGKAADARTDIFALGAVLYEMVTGRRAFEGKSQASLIAAILEKDPVPAASLQPLTPPALEHVVQSCLAKDPGDRWQSAGDVKRELQWIAATRAEVSATGRPVRERWIWGGALVALAVLAVVFLLGWLRAARGLENASRVVRTSITSPVKGGFIGRPALSPDGRRVAFVAEGPDRRRMLWLRSLSSLTAQSLVGTQGSSSPFWSPDGRSIGFLYSDGQKLKTLDLAKGTIQTLADTNGWRGGSWGPSGVILFAPTFHDGLYRIPEGGGEATPVTKLDAARGDQTHVFPVFLPDGRHFVFGVIASREASGLYLGSLDSTDVRLLVRGPTSAIYAAPGYLIFLRQGMLVAQPFDASRLVLSGHPLPIAEMTSDDSVLEASATESGLLVYPSAMRQPTELSWFDRTGKKLSAVGDPGFYESPRLSPDGRSLAVVQLDPKTEDRDVWIFDLARDSPRRFTLVPGDYRDPVWSPDASQLVYASGDRGTSLALKAADGATPEEILLRSSELKFPNDWSPDGRTIVYSNLDPSTAMDLWTLFLEPKVRAEPFLRTPFVEKDGHLSPDGRWIAYSSSESGFFNVHIRPFPGPGGARRVSSGGGGANVRWRRDGKELFYVTRDRKVMVVEVTGGSALELGEPRTLFDSPFERSLTGVNDWYDVAADGQRFIGCVVAGTPAEPSLVLVQNWAEGLKE